VILCFKLFRQAFIRQGDIIKNNRGGIRQSERAPLYFITIVGKR
jgi:hypothetical protein